MRSPGRSPRYSRFVVTGAVVGALVGVVFALLRGGDRVTQGMAYVGCFVALLGGLLAGLVAILLDRPEPGERAGTPHPATPPEQRAPTAP